MTRKQVRGSLLVIILLLSSMLQACGGGGTTAGGDSGSSEKVKIKWASWGNPGELSRYQELTKDFNKKHPDIEAEFIPIPGEYDQKILTQLTGGTAPDIFYAGDGLIVKLIENQSIENLTPYMDAPESLIKKEDYFEGLWGAAVRDGQTYGVTVDCNPMVLWYNKKVLKEAGITEMPADLQANGQWTWDKFKEMSDKIRDSKKYGYVLDNSWNSYHSWVTSNGGQVYDDEGNFVAASDPKAMEAFKFLYDNVKSKNITFSGTLPKGQGGDAMFMSNQVGFVAAGRWYLPLFKKNQGLEYDVVTWPTNTGNKIEPAGIPTAFLVMNKAAKNKEAAYTFFSEYVSKEGQRYRLQGGGNAVPSVQGTDDVVLEGNLPEHAQLFLDAREIGYSLTPFEAGIPGLSQDITSKFEALWLKDQDLESSLQDIQDMANKKIQDYKSGKN
ncbi:sugar ABC transporter substrate-binding protein [Paenibacillus glucanolyticus]|jgi:multiple sugar transport system substrate-binding protein|uniref:ABC transporter substrate-binding protein n=1 Tax=Paenibacillus TaxID=44249 RepID=UPI0003E2C220|nr:MULTISPECIES: sugar ABC transporter substrate-binding protein [Paenibacillus]ANA80938.1 ABC transporter substrate-binding protein [Paenibacillus glucanolyticus]AVV54990.1 sugar ABC transporter substrate-binding protein [Paenibacillus glucanolyticus]ETT40653.1 family 1 extracellular solute-binding protein [Paenibacillus sp. FSL R5-808]OMF81453.1 ABC transporter substrate-binding protein [Paenibacillus glucanolyticus]